MTDRADYRLAPHPDYGFLQITPTPDKESIARYYAEEFYAADYRGCNDSACDSVARDQSFHEARHADLLETATRTLGRAAHQLDWLDIGCGWCAALAYWQRQGVRVCGFDPAPEAIAHGQSLGIPVQGGGLDSLAVFERRFDVVSLLNVLEHLADPLQAVRDIRDHLLAPGGLLIIDVPNEFNAFQLAGQRTHDLPEWWVAPPAHLNYFSGTTLRRLLEGEGFAIESLEASFPLEMFLLMGERYVGDAALGRACHEKRMHFEANLRRQGQAETLRRFYRSLAEQDLGRQVTAFARLPGAGACPCA